jgi:hypothetical protein
MGRRDEDEMAGRDLRLVAIAGSVREAEAAERVLTLADVDYVVRLESYWPGGLMAIFATAARTGAYFYVLAGQHRYCCGLLREAGLRRLVTDPGTRLADATEEGGK